MLPVPGAEPFDSPDYIFEVKWDGVRAIGVIEDGAARLHGRNLRDLTPLYPELSSLPRALDSQHAVVDGEIAAWGTESLPDFALLRPRLLQPDAPVPPRQRSPIIYQVFDLLALDGRWLLDLPLYERRNLLHERLQPMRTIQVADFVRDEGIAFSEAVRSHGLGGIIAKHKASPYLPGERSSYWLELRAFQADDFVIGGYSFGGGLRNDPIASLFLGAYRNGKLDFIGEVSVGCSDREARQLLSLLQPLHTEACRFREPPQLPNRFYYWCRPELACHVRYSQWASDGRLRFPVFIAPRPDVPVEECTAP
jgi:DNA ligase D-like protein (predicted ligase)